MDHGVNEVKEELADTVKIEEEFFSEGNIYIAAEVSFLGINKKYFVLVLNGGIPNVNSRLFLTHLLQPNILCLIVYMLTNKYSYILLFV